ncbi:CPBP family intramembrane metalloprotease [Spiractinospora alimapuensis]|uniref:CPBP family intramembrane glutamic endopeptidase n=1 Tax=Spiractinospora alimapuensis TaxID=2820884 RepID=UPI001F1BA65A|nr:type II CAAX endopeptidase family protein [Spiractinospora alimapuensis]QVQ51560.1 CPBP family intramembrane metalloprotease [Spiractinospora alimapuensis]
MVSHPPPARRTIGDEFIRAGSSGVRATHPLATIPLTQIFYMLGLLPSMLMVGPLMDRLSAGVEDPDSLFLLELVAIPLGYVFPYVVLFVWLRWYERRTFFRSTGLGFGWMTLRGLGWGTVWGVAFIVGWYGIALASGIASVDRVGDFGPDGAAGMFIGGTLMLLMRVVMIGIEEQLFRGWMLQAVGARWGVLAGVLVSSVCFSAFHFFNLAILLPGSTLHEPHWVLMLNIFLWSVFAALITLSSGNLWAATAFHAAVLILPWFLFTITVPDGVGQWLGQSEAMGLVVLVIAEPSHYAGGAGFAGLFEGLPATGAMLVLIAGAWFWLRRGGANGLRETQSSASVSASS